MPILASWNHANASRLLQAQPILSRMEEAHAALLLIATLSAQPHLHLQRLANADVSRMLLYNAAALIHREQAKCSNR
jgi:hypothetical protein